LLGCWRASKSATASAAHISENSLSRSTRGTGVIDAAVFRVARPAPGFFLCRRNIAPGCPPSIDRQGGQRHRQRISPLGPGSNQRPTRNAPFVSGLPRYAPASLPEASGSRSCRPGTARAAQIQQEIWSRAVSASRADPSQNVARLLLPALNDMIDVTTDRTVAIHTHLPQLIFSLLMSVALLSSLLAGYAMEKRKNRALLIRFSMLRSLPLQSMP